MKLEIYFDYLCEFCEMGHRYWTELLPHYPRIQPVWKPCEAHPKVLEPYGHHSDLAAQGLLYLEEQGGDLSRYNDLLFHTYWGLGQRLDDLSVLARCAQQAGADQASFLEALRSGRYAAPQRALNQQAWERFRFQAVPSFVLENGRQLVSRLGVGVSREQLRGFLEDAFNP